MSQEPSKTHQQIRIHIDEHALVSPERTTGVALYQVGEVKAGYLLFREVTGNHEDVPIPQDLSEVLLSEDEHFHSSPRASASFDIFVNGEAAVWHRHRITYEEIVRLAFPTGPVGHDIRYSVSWTKPDGQEGSLRPGRSVRVVEGMIFDVRNTDKS